MSTLADLGAKHFGGLHLAFKTSSQTMTHVFHIYSTYICIYMYVRETSPLCKYLLPKYQVQQQTRSTMLIILLLSSCTLPLKQNTLTIWTCAFYKERENNQFSTLRCLTPYTDWLFWKHKKHASRSVLKISLKLVTEPLQTIHFSLQNPEYRLLKILGK